MITTQLERMIEITEESGARGLYADGRRDGFKTIAILAETRTPERMFEMARHNVTTATERAKTGCNDYDHGQSEAWAWYLNEHRRNA